MATKPPSSVKEFSPETLEKLVYASTETILTEEPNDRNRLNYHIWRWLIQKQGTLEEAINESGARIKIPISDAFKIIREFLIKKGLSPP